MTRRLEGLPNVKISEELWNEIDTDNQKTLDKEQLNIQIKRLESFKKSIDSEIKQIKNNIKYLENGR